MKKAYRLALSVSALTALGAPPVWADSQVPPSPWAQTRSVSPNHKARFHGRFGEILDVQPQQITVFLPHGMKTVQLPFSHLTIKAGWYPIPLGLDHRILQSGDVVHLYQKASHTVLRVEPMAFGTLVHSKTQWALALRTPQISGIPSLKPWPLSTTHVPLFGAAQVKEGQDMLVFGRVQQQTFQPVALAVKPLAIEAQLRSNQAGRLIFDSKNYGSFTYQLPSSASPWIRALGPKAPVILRVNPSTRAVLGVTPFSRHFRLMSCLTHNVYGQLIQKTPQNLQLKTSWGSQTVQLRGMHIKIIGTGPNIVSQVMDLPLGSHLFVRVFPKRQHMAIRVLPPPVTS